MQIEYKVNCHTHRVRTDSEGRYTFSVMRGGNVFITPELGLGVVTTPEHYAIMACHDRQDLDFTLRPVGQYAVSGTLFGLPMTSNILVNYTVNGQSGTTRSDASGHYVFTVPPEADVTITPSAQPGFLAVPSSYTLPNVSADTPDKNFAYVGVAPL